MKSIIVDINKPLKAKMYGFDESWHEPDGEDERGEYLVVDVQCILFPYLTFTKYPEITSNSGRSDCFELLPQD